MFVIQANDMSVILSTLYAVIMDHGRTVQPKVDGTVNRTSETKELLDVCFELEDPRNCLMFSAHRSFSIIYALVEALMLFNGSDKLKYYSQYNTNIGNFSDNGVTLRGCYGRRLNDNRTISKAVEMLKRDPHTRQCFLPIYEPYDLGCNSKDIPCTMGLTLNIRDEKLYMTAFMRSNDAIWGTPYDVFNFTNMQQVIANTLGVGLGSYTHHAVSMHIYAYHYDIARKVVRNTMKNVHYENDYNHYQWSMLAQRYIDMVEEGDLEIDGGFNDIFKVEKLYKDAGDEIYEVIEGLYDTFPWLKDFTKRWINGFTF